jgi:hypothetical protein
MTLKQFRDIGILKTGIEGHRLFPEARLNFMINKSMKFVQVQLNGLGYKRWEKSAIYSTTASTGAVTATTINDAGLGYVAGDLIVLTAGGNNCIVSVLTVGSNGEVATLQIISEGSGYSIATAISTTTNSTGGSGFKANVTAISAATLLVASTFGSVSVLKAQIPSDMLESSSSIIMMDVTDGTDKGTTKLEYNPNQFESMCHNSYSAPTIKEAGYMRLANYLYWFPATITTAICYYFSTLVDLVSDSETSLMPIEFEDFVMQKFVNDIKSDLGEIKDVQMADQEIANAITNAYQKAIGTIAQSGIAMKQKDNEVVQ